MNDSIKVGKEIMNGKKREDGKENRRYSSEN
jgi:hypothetical protein